MVLKDFKQLLGLVGKRKKQRIAVAMAQDADVLLAIDAAHSAGLAEGILVGSKSKLQKIADAQQISLVTMKLLIPKMNRNRFANQ